MPRDFSSETPGSKCVSLVFRAKFSTTKLNSQGTENARNRKLGPKQSRSIFSINIFLTWNLYTKSILSVCPPLAAKAKKVLPKSRGATDKNNGFTAFI